MLQVTSASLILPSQKDQASVADKIKGFFSSNKDKDQNGTAEDISAETAEVLKALKKATGPLELEVTTRPVGYQPSADYDKREASKRYGSFTATLLRSLITILLLDYASSTRMKPESATEKKQEMASKHTFTASETR
jgi:hypothetical protein